MKSLLGKSHRTGKIVGAFGGLMLLSACGANLPSFGPDESVAIAKQRQFEKEQENLGRDQETLATERAEHRARAAQYELDKETLRKSREDLATEQENINAEKKARLTRETELVKLQENIDDREKVLKKREAAVDLARGDSSIRVPIQSWKGRGYRPVGITLVPAE